VLAHVPCSHNLLLSCCPVTQFGDPQELCQKILSGVYNAPDWLSSGAKDLLSRMLTLDPEQRITLDGVSRVCGECLSDTATARQRALGCAKHQISGVWIGKVTLVSPWCVLIKLWRCLPAEATFFNHVCPRLRLYCPFHRLYHLYCPPTCLYTPTQRLPVNFTNPYVCGSCLTADSGAPVGEVWPCMVRPHPQRLCPAQ
jgi:hypothetical protein